MDFFLVAWGTLFILFFGSQGAYYLYLRQASRRPWNLQTDDLYMPQITVIVPLHNEEKTVEFKLRNLSKVDYPRDKLQVILVDDASSDGTLKKASEFLDKNNRSIDLSVEVLSIPDHHGKANALNIALAKAKYNVVAMTDADSFWAPDALSKILPYLADPSIGAVIGQERILNSTQSWITETEKTYVDLVNRTVRLGESKIHSNIFFHGLLAVYKKEYLVEFNTEIDDSGTALDIVQKGARTLSIPEAECFDMFPITWKGKISVKTRRASQLIGICARCMRLAIRKKLVLPKKIAIPEMFLFLFNPIIFFFLLALTVIVIGSNLLFSTGLLLALVLALAFGRTRSILLETLQSNFVLILGLATFLSGKKFVTWQTLSEPRSLLKEDFLKKKNLI